MFNLFDTVGTILRNVFAFSFFAIWGLSSVIQDVRSIAELPWISLGAMLAVAGVVLTGFVALVMLLRRDPKPREPYATPPTPAPADGFDAELIINRHLARRASEVLPPMLPVSTLPVSIRTRGRRGFGRKIR